MEPPQSPVTQRRPGARSPLPPASPPSSQVRRTQSPFSESSESSQATISSAGKRALYGQQHIGQYTQFQNFSRPSVSINKEREAPSSRKSSPYPPQLEIQKHRRQHSQGFFEPSLPSATPSDHNSHMANLSASQIAAQAAMQHHPSLQHIRKRSQTVPNPNDQEPSSNRSISTTASTLHVPATNASSRPIYQNGVAGGNKLAATTAANLAFPRTISPHPSSEYGTDKEQKPAKAEKSKMKLFSKPKHIGIYREKDGAGNKPLYSPNKMGISGPSGLSKMVNASTTSLADSTSGGGPSMYTSANNSTTALSISERPGTSDGKEKSHKHHFLTRQKLKLKDKEDRHLALSSASSNSRPIDPSAPSLYSFAPSSPAPSATSFAKSMSGLDLRHGGKALRDKRKEEKAAQALATTPTLSHDSAPRESEDRSRSDRPNLSSLTSQSFLSATTPTLASSPLCGPSESFIVPSLQGWGLNNMTPDDVWDFLKAKLLVVFEGEDVRHAVEDLNRLVLVYIQRCVQKQTPCSIVEDLRDLFDTGFASLNQTLRTVVDHRLIPRLVDTWLFVFGTVLPFMQAVFLPLDLEFKGRGSIMTSREATDFWSNLPPLHPQMPNSRSSAAPAQAPDTDLDVRILLLISFRDTIILPRHQTLKTLFSHLSLDSINASPPLQSSSPSSCSSIGQRPSTSQSLDPNFSSFNSQGSTLLDSATRSRATSNTSAPDVAFQSLNFSPPSAAISSVDKLNQITAVVARMLQCVAILASIQSGDEKQMAIESLAKELKHNWLGRGRTGRNRRGYVGSRLHGSANSITGREPFVTEHEQTQVPVYGTGGARLSTTFEDDKSRGSPTPTPSYATTRESRLGNFDSRPLSGRHHISLGGEFGTGSLGLGIDKDGGGML